MKAMIFAAGYGKRLLPLTEKTPKALIPVKGRPMLDWVINHLTGFGVKNIIINTHYLHEDISNHIEKSHYSIPIALSYEKVIMGTGGGLYHTKEFWGDDDFFVCNADILCNANLKEFLQHHQRCKKWITLAVNHRQSSSMLLVDEAGCLVGRYKNRQEKIITKPTGSISKVGFCGFHIISPKFFSLVKLPVEFSIIDEYFKLLEKGLEIATWNIKDSYWEDIGTPATLNKANHEFASHY